VGKADEFRKGGVKASRHIGLMLSWQRLVQAAAVRTSERTFT